VHDAESDFTRRPTDAARRAHVGWQELAPTAVLTIRRVAAPVASRRGQEWESGPASAAHHLVLAAIEQSLAHDTATRQEELGERSAA
jgi:hypothetical protein